MKKPAKKNVSKLDNKATDPVKKAPSKKKIFDEDDDEFDLSIDDLDDFDALDDLDDDLDEDF